jgi:pSer/pThr/pTyr-binding forkhead associated (FHA) protein
VTDLPLHRTSPAELKARLEAERQGTPFLLYADGAGRQQIVVLGPERGRWIVGRGAGTDVSLDWDADVSRIHAELERLGQAWTVADDGLSRNGTYVNGDRIRGRRRLAERDQLRFGVTTVVFRAPPAGARPTRTQATALGAESGSVAISPAQRRVLVALARPCLAEGAFASPATNREIAEELYLTVESVKTHLRALTVKFGIQDLPQNRKRARLVELALQRGEISPRDLEPPGG